MKYGNLWFVFVRVVPQSGYNYTDLVETEDGEKPADENYIGAWANAIVQAPDIVTAVDIVKEGMGEKHFEVEYIDSVQNLQSLIDYEEVKTEVVEDADKLLEGGWKFFITGPFYAYRDVDDEGEE